MTENEEKVGVDINQTELVWTGKYDYLKRGKKNSVERVALPSQVVETINEPREKQRQLDSFEDKEGDDWKNKLIWGDNKYVLTSLLDEYQGKIDLIYIDPPFDVGADFSVKIKLGDESLIKSPSIIEEKAYRDTWGRGTDSYLQMMYDRLVLMKELLSEDGTIFVHCDWHVGHYIKILLDEIFGKENFRNEIIVRRTAKHTAMQFEKIKSLQVFSDSIFLYAKSNDTYFNKPMREASESQKSGNWHGFSDNCYRPTQRYELFGMYPPSEKGRWIWEKDRAYRAIENYNDFEKEYSEGNCSSFEEYASAHPDKEFVRYNNGSPQYWILARDEIMCDTSWGDIQAYSQRHNYATEKSESLLERIIYMGSNEGDIIADFFCGSGTTLAVAEKLGRCWIGADLGKFAIHTTKKRLLDMNLKTDGVICRPFEILNLGRYERRVWQRDNLGESQLDYIKFIVELYHAEFVSGYNWLHGKKGPVLVHVGAIDSQITIDELLAVLDECTANSVKEVHLLGWEFDLGIKETLDIECAKRGVKAIPKKIPREVMDKRAVESGEVQFYELAHLDAKTKQEGRKVGVELTEFIISDPELIPPELREKIKNWLDYIDYWAVDWDFKEDTFHNQWQDFRTKKDRSLKTKTPMHEYKEPGEYNILVKVVDVFGNDTSKLIPVKIK